jgi:hypothetical protein
MRSGTGARSTASSSAPEALRMCSALLRQRSSRCNVLKHGGMGELVAALLLHLGRLAFRSALQVDTIRGHTTFAA